MRYKRLTLNLPSVLQLKVSERIAALHIPRGSESAYLLALVARDLSERGDLSEILHAINGTAAQRDRFIDKLAQTLEK